MPTILLRNGTVLVHQASKNSRAGFRVEPLRNHSVLICNSFLASIAPHIDPPNQDTHSIDCTGKIISPGFVDTHHHLWQTQSKGTHADHLLLDYLATGRVSCLPPRSESTTYMNSIQAVSPVLHSPHEMSSGVSLAAVSKLLMEVPPQLLITPTSTTHLHIVSFLFPPCHPMQHPSIGRCINVVDSSRCSNRRYQIIRYSIILRVHANQAP